MINNLKAISIAIFCWVTILCSETQCMDQENQNMVYDNSNSIRNPTLYISDLRDKFPSLYDRNREEESSKINKNIEKIKLIKDDVKSVIFSYCTFDLGDSLEEILKFCLKLNGIQFITFGHVTFQDGAIEALKSVLKDFNNVNFYKCTAIGKNTDSTKEVLEGILPNCNITI